MRLTHALTTCIAIDQFEVLEKLQHSSDILVDQATRCGWLHCRILLGLCLCLFLFKIRYNCLLSQAA